MFLTRQLASQQFISIIAPEVKRLADVNIIKRASLALVLLDPSVPYAPGEKLPILFSGGVKDEPWAKPYDEFAQAKAMISWRTGLSSRVVQQTMPHLVESGDTVWWGSVVLDGLIVAASGVMPEHDEMLALYFAGACRARTITLMREFQEEQRANNYSADFYPQ